MALALALMVAHGGAPAGAAGTARSAGPRHRVAAARADRAAPVTKAPRPLKTEKAAAAADPTMPPPATHAPGEDGQPEDVAEETSGIAIEPAKNSPQILNRGEMLSLARRYSAAIAESLLAGEKHREMAVRDRDSIKLACIQDRLSNMKNMKRMADDRLAATERPTIRGDELNLRHEFRGVELAYKRVVELQRELQECVGENLQVTGPAGSVPPSVDPSGSNAEIPRMERPTPASIFY